MYKHLSVERQATGINMELKSKIKVELELAVKTF